MKYLPIYSQDFLELHKDFSKAMQVKAFSNYQMYTTSIREFLFFIETKQIETIEEVKANHIIAYYEYLKERPNQKREGTLSDSNIRRQLYTLRLFFDHLIQTGKLKSSPAHLPKFGNFKYKERNALTTQEVKELYQTCENKFDTALLGLAYGCGLRRAEIIQLKVNDIQFSQGMLSVRKGKFGKSRTIPLSNTVLKDLKEYLVNERNHTHKNNDEIPATTFLLSKQGLPIHINWLNTRIKQLVEKTNDKTLLQKQISLHSLRHSIATHMLDKGADIEFVQGFLGHTLLDTTHLYSKRRKQKALLSYHINLQTNNLNGNLQATT